MKGKGLEGRMGAGGLVESFVRRLLWRAWREGRWEIM